VLNKDGSFQRSARFRGPDLDSATPAELIATTARLNSALRRLGSGWAIFVEAVRRPAQDYPDSDFPDPASALVERERAAQFAEEGAHFESGYFLTSVVDAARRGRRAPKAGSTRARPRKASTARSCSTSSSTAPIGCCGWSKGSCPKSPGSMTARR
jgi:type IV secretory pathway VirB4 component